MRHQQIVRDYLAEHRLGAPLDVQVLDLASEVGELAKAVLASSKYGKQTPAVTAEVRAELADVAYSLVVLINHCETSVDDLVLTAVEKYRRRIRVSGTPGSSAEGSP